MTRERFAVRSDPEVLEELGRRLAAVRAARGLTQSEAAEQAGLGRATVSRAEQGENPNLLTVVRLLRVYGRLDALDAFLPEPEVSPLALIRSARRDRG